MFDRSSGRLIASIVLGACALAANGAPARGGATATIGLPNPGTLSNSGFTVLVESEWAELAGYRPVRITITAPGPAAANQTIGLELGVSRSWNRHQSMKVSTDVDWPAGTQSKSILLPVPQQGVWMTISLDTWIDGEHQSDLSVDQMPIGNNAWNIYSPTMLFVGDAPPDVSLLGGLLMEQGFLRDPRMQGGMVGGSVVQGAAVPATLGAAQPASYPTLVHRPASALPDNWLYYSSLTIICISPSDWQALATTNPRAQAAIRAWLAAGGNLVLLGPAAHETGPLLVDASLDIEHRAEAWYAAAGAGGIANALLELIPGNAPPKGNLRWRDHLFGRIVAVGADPAFPGAREQWQQLLATIGNERSMWPALHGVPLNQNNNDFWNWLIEGVGLAPVTAFRVLITLFVLLIGPLNYYYLRRAHRLHLLLFTVPACALATTAGLLIWSVARDGVQVRVRGRSVTLLDQRTGAAACWGRTTYYAPLAPQSLHFSGDVMAMPFDADFVVDYNDQSPTRRMKWDGQQHLVSGWLPSRTTTQLLTVRSRRSTNRLQVGPVAGDGRLNVENELGVAIERLLVVDETGQAFSGSQLAAGATGQLAPVAIDPAAATLPAELTQWKAAYEALVPRDPRTDAGDMTIFVRRRRYGRYSPYGTPGPPFNVAQSGSRLESAVRAIESKLFRLVSAPPDVIVPPTNQGVSPARGPELPPLDLLSPRTYIAQVARSPEAEYGLEDYREENGLHLVVGRW